jgi:hypothetical protein
MKPTCGKLSAAIALCALVVPADRHMMAQKPGARPSLLVYGASQGEVVGIGVGIAAAGAAIGIGVYMAVNHGHSVTGCARSTQDGITLASDSDKQTYTLVGDVAGIMPGDRVRVSGKKSKQTSGGTRQFLVQKVSRDFGACEASSSAR